MQRSPTAQEKANVNLSLSTTAVLLQNAKAGIESSRNALAQRCLPHLRRMAHGRMPRQGIRGMGAEDIVQETLLRAFSTLERFVPRCEGAFYLYLRRILVNVIVDLNRKEQRSLKPETLVEEPLSPGPSPVEEAVGRETWERYRQAVAQLSDQQCQAVVLFVECSMNFNQIAEALGSPTANAARMVVARGLKRVEELMHA